MRADQFLVSQGVVSGRDRAGRLIEEGKVTIGGKPIRKKSEEVTDGEIEIIDDCPFVGRGGLKLEGAFRAFSFSPEGLVCADIGASTGGFTDCLLRNGAKKVFAIDSGSNQLHPSLLSDPRVVSMESTNARYLSSEDLGTKVDLCVMDVSFISQTLLFEAVASLLKPGGDFISLIKPQFEVGREKLGKNGIVRKEEDRRFAVQKVKEAAKERHFVFSSLADSPIEGGDGNREYLIHFVFEGGDGGK